MSLWDKMPPQAIQTLNLLRTSPLHPQLPAYAHVHGFFNFNRTFQKVPLPVPTAVDRIYLSTLDLTEALQAPAELTATALLPDPAMHALRTLTNSYTNYATTVNPPPLAPVPAPFDAPPAPQILPASAVPPVLPPPPFPAGAPYQNANWVSVPYQNANLVPGARQTCQRRPQLS
jgi:hypothetical protein